MAILCAGIIEIGVGDKEKNLNKNVVLKCDCSCGFMEFFQFDQDADYLNIDYYPSGWYAYQNSWKENLKLIWSILTGKKYSLYGLVLNKKEIAKLKKFIETL